MPKTNGNSPISKIPYRQQSSIGGKQELWREQSPLDTPEYGVFFAVVTKVNYMLRTVQYIPESGYRIGQAHYNSENQDNGMANAKIPTKFWGKTVDGDNFGDNTFIQQGSRVLIAFEQGDKSRPVVLNVYPPNDLDSTAGLAVIGQEYLDDNNLSVQETLWSNRVVYPTRQLQDTSGNGGYLRTFNGNTFMKVSRDKLGLMGLSDYALSGDGSNLETNGQEIVPIDSESQSFLFKHASREPDDKHNTRFYLDSKGSLHLSFEIEDEKGASYVDYSKETGIIYTRTLDSASRDSSESYLTVNLGNAKGSFEAVHHANGTEKSISLGADGFTVDGDLLVTEGTFDKLSQQFAKLSADFIKLQDAINSIGLDFIAGLPLTIEQINIHLGTLDQGVSGAKKSASDTMILAKSVESSLNTFIGNTTQTISEMNTTIGLMKTETDDYKANKVAYKKAVTDINDTLPTIATNKSDIAYLKTSVKNNTTTINSHSTQIKTLTDTSGAHGVSITNINSDIKNLKAKDTTQDSTITALITRVTNLETANTQLKKDYETLAQRVAILETGKA